MMFLNIGAFCLWTHFWAVVSVVAPLSAVQVQLAALLASLFSVSKPEVIQVGRGRQRWTRKESTIQLAGHDGIEMGQ